MPTLHQIGISTPIRGKLSGIKRPRPDDDLTSTNPPFIPVTTPAALLSRPIQSLSRALDVTRSNLRDIRAGVADALISDECIGHSGAVQIAEWNGRLLHQEFSRNDRSGQGDDENVFHRELRPPQLTVGSISALEMAAHSSDIKIQHISTGSRGFDRLLASNIDLNMKLAYPFNASIRNDANAGGVPFGMVTEVVGPPSSGKTQFCISVVSNTVQEVIYVTSVNVQSISRRLFSLCMERARTEEKANEQDAKQLAEKQMGRILLVRVSNGYELLALLAKTERQIMESKRPSTLLVIDSISSIIGHHLSSLKAGAALINQVGLALKRIARGLDSRFDSNGTRQRFGVLVVNGTVSRQETFDGKRNKPAMGRYWHASDIELWMEEVLSSEDKLSVEEFYRDEIAGLHRDCKKVVEVTLLNHWAKKSGGKVQFVIGSGGLHDL